MIYNVIVNEVDPQNIRTFKYIYNKMKVQVSVSSKGFIIIYQTGTSKSAEAIWNSREVEDAVRKCLLVQLIYFGHNVDFRDVMIKEQNSDEIMLIKTPRVYNLIPETVEVDLTALRDDNFVGEYLMKRVKSKYESGIAALFSYIYAKSKHCEEDKFTYFWRSFNGIYNSIGEEDINTGNTTNKMESERDYLKNWLSKRENGCYMVSAMFNSIYKKDGLSYAAIERKNRAFFHNVENSAAEAEWTPDDVKAALDAPGNINDNLANLLGLTDYLFPQDHNSVYVKIKDIKRRVQISLYGYLMTELAYQIRCTYFHAVKPILLHTTTNNPEFRGLQLANALLEHYLDHHIKDEVISKINMERELEQ